jgi:hypothetical protein
MGCPAPQAPSLATWVGVQRAVARHGGPGGSGCRPCRRHPVRVPASVRRPVSGASVQCPRVPVHTTGVQCPVRRPSVQVSHVRRPVSVRSTSADRSEVVERGGGAGSRTAGMAGVGVVACRVHNRLVVCPSRSLALEAGAGRAGVNGGVGLDSAVDTGKWLGGRVDRMADPDRPEARGGSPVGREPRCAVRSRRPSRASAHCCPRMITGRA